MLGAVRELLAACEARAKRIFEIVLRGLGASHE